MVDELELKGLQTKLSECQKGREALRQEIGKLYIEQASAEQVLDELNTHATSWMKAISSISDRNSAQERNIVLSFIIKIADLRQCGKERA